ncbi:MAG: DUF2065 domain-containing protein [Gammaproteobacteria bacterium]
MWVDILSAVALVFVLEGIMPFLNPEGLKKMFSIVSQMSNGSLRVLGLCSMAVGLGMLYVVRQ